MAYRKERRISIYAAWLFGAFLCAMLATPAARADLPLDSAGWSILAPSADSRLLYVSSTSGNDSTGATYLPGAAAVGADPFHPAGPIQPFATYAAAYAKTRNGYPDWVLFKRGETWTAGLSGMRNGRSDAERMVVTSYGDATTRPLFLTGTSGALAITSGSGGRLWAQYQAIVGLHFYCQGRDPASPDFAGYTSGLSAIDYLGQSSNGYVGSVRNILVEDCHLEWYGGNITMQATGTSTLQYVAVRRNVLNNSYNTSSHSQGFFAYNVGFLTLEENVFDHNGWIMTGDSLQGGATMYNHNTYFSETHDIVFRGNMFLRASSIGTKWCSNDGEHTGNIVLENNLYVEGEIAMQIGGNGTAAYGFSNIQVRDNVMQSIGRTQPTGRTLGWGIWTKDWDGGVMERNYFLRNDTPAVNNLFALSIEGGSNRNVLFRDNTIYGLYSGGPLVVLSDGAAYSSMTLTGNRVDGGPYAVQLVQASGSLANYTLSNNSYFTTRTAAQWFRASGANKNFAQWQALAGEVGSTTGTRLYVDPTRTVETYDAALGGPGTLDDFIAQAKLQSKANWRRAYTAAAINDYIRAGFETEVPPVFSADPLVLPDARVGRPYAASLAPLASDANTSDTLTFSKRAGPGWLNVAADGSLAGTPLAADAGPSSFTVRVTDRAGLSDDATMSIAVNAATAAPGTRLILY